MIFEFGGWQTEQEERIWNNPANPGMKIANKCQQQEDKNYALPALMDDSTSKIKWDSET